LTNASTLYVARDYVEKEKGRTGIQARVFARDAQSATVSGERIVSTNIANTRPLANEPYDTCRQLDTHFLAEIISLSLSHFFFSSFQNPKRDAAVTPAGSPVSHHVRFIKTKRADPFQRSASGMEKRVA